MLGTQQGIENQRINIIQLYYILYEIDFGMRIVSHANLSGGKNSFIMETSIE